jgi:cytochrome b pre-mRNA-processing protein 3
VVLIQRRLKGAGEGGRALASDILDSLFADMDRSLREMGVGDLGVGRRVKTMARAYHGRMLAYDAVLDGDADALGETLARNVFATSSAGPGAVALSHYVRSCMAALAGTADEAILAGLPRLPDAGGTIDG